MKQNGESLSSGEFVISKLNGKLYVPDNPIIPFVKGDGCGIGIWTSVVKVLDTFIKNCYNGKRQISWLEIFPENKSKPGLPEETIEAFRKYRILLKGQTDNPGATVNHPENTKTMEQNLCDLFDLYTCLKPVKYLKGTPSALKNPENINVTIFLENTGKKIQFETDSSAGKKLGLILKKEGFRRNNSTNASYEIREITREVTNKIMKSSIEFALENKLPSVTIVHDTKNAKFTEGNFIRWAYETARNQFPKETVSFEDCGGNPPPELILVQDASINVLMKQILNRSSEYNIIVATNSTGQFISEILTAQAGGSFLAPIAYINYESGNALFMTTHESHPKYAGLDKSNPLSVIITATFMFRYLGWKEVADNIEKAIEKVMDQKIVTYDLARFIDGAKEVMCSEFCDALIKNQL